MKIIRPTEMRQRKSSQIRSAPVRNEYFHVPFVPAYDLIEGKNGLPTDEEAASIALALHTLLVDRGGPAPSPWLQAARMEGVSKRDL